MGLHAAGRTLLPGLALLACVGLAGCRIFKATADISRSADDQAGRLAAKDGTATRSADAEAIAAALDSDAWIPAMANEPASVSGIGFRWRHPALESILAHGTGRPSELKAALDDNDPVKAANAAIALARLSDRSGRERLLDAVRAARLRLPLRLAAIEALAALDELATLRTLLDQYGYRPAANQSAYVPEIHTELLVALARFDDALDDQRFAAALQSPSPAVKAAALDAWRSERRGELPARVVDLQSDADGRVATAALSAMAARRHAEALDSARAALADSRLEVRRGAAAALGVLGGQGARRSLEELLVASHPELIRAAAIAALANMDAYDSIWAAAGDPSWRVRHAVATALATPADPPAARIARRLLSDPNGQVQQQVIAALAEWPLATAGPLLLDAMERSGYLARRAAATQLAGHWPPAERFSADAPADGRRETLAELHQAWAIEFGPLEAEPFARRSAAIQPPPVTVSPERLERAAELLEQLSAARPHSDSGRALLGELSEIGPNLPQLLEQLVVDRGVVAPEIVYQEVLPAHGAEFAALARLAAGLRLRRIQPDTRAMDANHFDVQQRRQAATSLAEIAAERPLSPLALVRLADVVSGEPDALVWSAVMRAIRHDSREPSIRLAYAAAGHRSAEVRRLACEHLGAHPGPGHARVLLPALADRDPSVVLAAAGALGHQAALDDTAPLARLLATPDKSLRLVVATSLARLRATSGAAALERLAHDLDPEIRRRAALLMGELGDPAFTATLIGLLNDSLGVRRAALTGLAQVVGRDVARDAGEPLPSVADQVIRWKEWWRRVGT